MQTVASHVPALTQHSSCVQMAATHCSASAFCFSTNGAVHTLAWQLAVAAGAAGAMPLGMEPEEVLLGMEPE